MEGPVDPTRRFIEVPRPDNPNLMDVYEINEEAAAGRDDDLIRASLTAPQSRPPGRIGAKARTNVVNMPSADDADPLTPENDNNRANRRAFKNPVLQGDDPDGDGENLRKRAREDSEQVFGYRLYDWQNGTPLDDVSFDAIKRHLHRLALHTVDPVVSFVAGVAFASGSGADNFFVNGTQVRAAELFFFFFVVFFFFWISFFSCSEAQHQPELQIHARSRKHQRIRGAVSHPTPGAGCVATLWKGCANCSSD